MGMKGWIDNAPGCGQGTSGECAQPRPCASLSWRRGNTRSDRDLTQQKRTHARSPKGCSSLNLERIMIYEKCKVGFLVWVELQRREEWDGGRDGMGL